MKSKGPRSSPPTSPSLFIKAAPKRRHAFTHESSNPSSAAAGVRRTKSDALQARILEFGKRNPLGEVTSRVNLPPRVASVSPVQNRPRPTTEVPEYGHQLSQDSILSGHSSGQGASLPEHSSVPAGGHDFHIDYTTALHDDSASPAGTLQERKLLPLSSPRHTVHKSPKSPWLTARSDVQTSSARHRENISLDRSPLGLSRHRAKSSFDSQNEGFTQQGRERNLVKEKTLSNQVLRKNASYAMPRLPPSSGSALRRRSEMPIGRRPSDSILDEASWRGAPESLVAVGGEPDTLHRSFFAGVPHATSTPYIQNQAILEDDSVVGIGNYLEHQAHYDGPSRKLSSPPPDKNIFWGRFCSLPAPDLPGLPSRMTSAPPIRLIPSLPTTATHLHDDSILSSFQTTCGPSSNAQREVEQLSDEENKDDGNDADLIPPTVLPKLLRTPTSVVCRAVPDPPAREQGLSDMDIEEDLVPEPGRVRDQPTIDHISHVTTSTEVKEEPQDDEYHGRGHSHDPGTSSEPRSRLAMSSLASSDDEEPKIKGRSRNAVTFRLPTPPKIRVRIKRQYRKKGDRVALSDLDPKRVWMKILEDPPEIDSEGEDSDDSLLLVQKS